MLLVQFSAEKEAERALDPPPILLRPVLQRGVITHSEEGDRSPGISSPLFHEVTFVSQLLSDAGEDDEF